MGFFMRRVYRHAKGGGPEKCLNGWACKESVEQVFLCVFHKLFGVKVI